MKESLTGLARRAAWRAWINTRLDEVSNLHAVSNDNEQAYQGEAMGLRLKPTPERIVRGVRSLRHRDIRVLAGDVLAEASDE